MKRLYFILSKKTDYNESFISKSITTTLVVLITCILSGSTFRTHTDCIHTGDNYFTLMRYKDAIAWYNLDSSKAEAQWKIARAYICYADNAIRAEKEVNFRKAEKAARRSIQIDETNSNGHTWMAASLGNIAMYEGSSTKVKLCNEIKKQLNRAIQLNPKDDLAYSILGTLYREIGNISWIEKELALAFIGKIPDGGFPDSKKCLSQAIILNPQIVRHWFELGMLYKYWGKKEHAITAFTKAKLCPVLVASDREKINKINTLLEKMKN